MACTGTACGTVPSSNSLRGRWDPILPPSVTVDDIPYGTGAAAVLVGGRDLFLWGGFCGFGACDAGARLDASGEWSLVASAGDGRGRVAHEMVATADNRVVIAGGLGCDSLLVHCAESLVYDATTDTWLGVDAGGLDFRRTDHSLVMLESGDALLFGGRTGDRTNVYFDDTYLLDLEANAWRASASMYRPARRQHAELIAIAGGAFLFGGSGGVGVATLSAPALYDSASDEWRPCATEGSPGPRIIHSMVWTGAEVIVWGGGVVGGTTGFATGFAYDPELDAWRPISSEGAPSPRAGHVAVWLPTYGAMVVWGGAGASCERGRGDGRRVCGDAFAYFPMEDRWASVATEREYRRAVRYAFATETGFIFWGGLDENAFDRTDGARLTIDWPPADL